MASVVLSMFTNLRESAVVPEIAMMRKAISDVTEFAFLDILLDWVHWLFLGNLSRVRGGGPFRMGALVKVGELADLHLCIGPSWNLYNHVEDGLLLIGV